MANVGRNAPCPCGSGRKYKRCCGSPEAQAKKAAARGPQPHAPRPKPPPLAGTHLRLKVTLTDSDPLVWRRIQICEDATFGELHRAVQLLGWEEEHAWAFRTLPEMELIVKGPQQAYGADGEDLGDPSHGVLIRERLREVGDRCLYLYDFGDSWLHLIEVEAVETLAEHEAPIVRHLLDGEGPFPPENCGGIPGFQRIREYVATGKDPWDDAESLREWLGDDPLPAFDLGVERLRFDWPPASDRPRVADADAGEEDPDEQPIEEPTNLAMPALNEGVVGLLLKEIKRQVESTVSLDHFDVEVGKATWTDHNVDMRVSISMIRGDGVVMNREAETFLERCFEFALEPEDLGKILEVDDERWQIRGLRPRARAPVVCYGLDRKRPTEMRFTAGIVRKLLGRK